MEDKPYYTMKEFCDKMGIHYNTARNMIVSGRLSAFKMGVGGKTSNYRIPSSELYRLAEVSLGEVVDKLVKKKTIQKKGNLNE